MKNRKYIISFLIVLLILIGSILLIKGYEKRDSLKHNEEGVKVSLNDGKTELSKTKVNEKSLETLDKIGLKTKLTELKSIKGIKLLESKIKNKDNDFKYLDKYSVKYRDSDDVTLNVYYNEDSSTIGEIRYYYNDIKSVKEAESFLNTNFGKDVSLVTVVDGYKKSISLYESEAKKRNDKKELSKIEELKSNDKKEGTTHILLVKEPLSDGTYRGTDFFIAVKGNKVLSMYERRNSDSDNIIKFEKSTSKGDD